MGNKGTYSSKTYHSTIDQHKMNKRVLVPPLATIPRLKVTSWVNDGLPELLWAALLVSHLPPANALALLRKIVKYAAEFHGDDRPSDITHTGLSSLQPAVRDEILDILVEADEHRNILRPLLLFDIPSRKAWATKIRAHPSEIDWQAVMFAVGRTLDHQSRESTDCRWVRLLCMMVSGRIKFPLKAKGMAEEILYYPDRGDLRGVRPTIRAMELGLREMDKTVRSWPAQFWQQCLRETPCYCFPESEVVGSTIHVSLERVKQLYDLLVGHCNRTRTTSSKNIRHDTVFGVSLYCLSIVLELLRNNISQSILARIALRTIVDCFISLKYLVTRDTSELWESYRVFGAGQAKLSYLKLDELVQKPGYVDVNTLQRLANEDIWEELLPIDLGHWAGKDLRTLSIGAGVKDVYDRFYSWTSTFSHGHWGAIRDVGFTVCANPLHRLHRIPRNSARVLSDVIPDVCFLIDGLLETVSQCYPQFPHRLQNNLNKRT